MSSTARNSAPAASPAISAPAAKKAGKKTAAKPAQRPAASGPANKVPASRGGRAAAAKPKKVSQAITIGTGAPATGVYWPAYAKMLVRNADFKVR